MPVSGYFHHSVWRRFYQPVALLDREWDRDREWRSAVVERLKRGEAAPRSLSVDELIPSPVGGGVQASGGWEITEAWAKDADRSRSAFLTDEAIALRLPERRLRKQAYAEYLEEQKEFWLKQEARRGEKEAAELEAAKAVLARAERLAKRQAREDEEWADRAKEIEEEAWHRSGREAIILRSRWACDLCKGDAKIEPTMTDVYVLTCPCRRVQLARDVLVGVLTRAGVMR